MINVLAIDDIQTNLDLIKATFSDHADVHVLFATRAQHGIELLHTNNIDVILLDIDMPGMNGLEALKIIRDEYSSLPIVMVTASHEKKNEALELGASDFISKPYDINELYLRTINYAKLKQTTDQINNQRENLEIEVLERTLDLNKALELAYETEKEIALRLGRVAEYRDIETGGHIRRMSKYSELLAKLYGLDEDEVELILHASPLHDVGKVGIPDNVLLKPGRFEPEEFEIMKSHASLGAQILSGTDRFPTINTGRIIALEHHEKWDGSGYPKGKSGEDIHIFGRITAIADVFDALTHDRVYKKAWSVEQTLDYIKGEKGKSFEPRLVDLLIENIDDILEIKNKHNK